MVYFGDYQKLSFFDGDDRGCIPIIPSKSFKVLKTLIPIVVYDVAGNYKPYNG